LLGQSFKLHDPVRYPEPDSFNPERFINSDGSLRDDPALSTIFGLGKRICPGRHLTDALFFIIVASFLSVFNIKGDGCDGGPDAYPFTGSGVKAPSSWWCRRLEELTADFLFLAFRAPPPSPSSKEIERQKNSLLPMPRRNELLMLSVSLVLHFFVTEWQ
jgi:hypothetical protein